MKRILKLLARLYPAEWRERYGAEYEALLEEGTPCVVDAFDVIWSAVEMQMTSWSFVGVVFPCVLTGGLIAVVIGWVAPPQYVSQTTFMVTPAFQEGVCGDQSGLPAELQGSKPAVCADTTIFKDYLKFASGDGFDREFLASVIQKENLYPREPGSMDAVIDKMWRNIHVASTGKEGSWQQFSVQFDYPDPHVAQKVDDELAGQVIVRAQNEEFSQFLVVNKKELQERMTFLQEGLRLAKNAEDASDLRSEIRQTQAAQSVATHWQPFTLESVRLKLASFPQKPNGLSRTQLGMIGLFGGLLCGLSLAAGTTKFKDRRKR